MRNNITRKVIKPNARILGSSSLTNEGIWKCSSPKRRIYINSQMHATIIPKLTVNNTPHIERNKSTPSSFQRKYNNRAAIRLAVKLSIRIVSQNEREDCDVWSMPIFQGNTSGEDTTVF